MKLLRATASTISDILGRTSPVINTLRPTYDFLLDFSSGGRGILQTVNDREQFRIDPYYRTYFPEVKDPEVCGYMRDRVQSGAVCLNVGAHVGIYALCLARWSGPKGRVYAFEPNPEAREVLERHVKLNDVGEQIEIVGSAVSKEPGEASFFATEVEGFSRLGEPNPYARHGKLTPVTVPVTTVDAFCAQRGLTPDWIMMDIEGYEIAALEGACKTIEAGRGRLNLIVEMHPNVWSISGASRERMEALISELSLNLVSLTGQVDPLAEFGIVCLTPV